MSFTLRGRVETRLAASLLPALVAAVLALVLAAWWPLALAGAMAATGIALDLALHRLLPYQPGWLGLPLGVLELGLVMLAVTRLGVGAPLLPALAFYAASWLLTQILVHAGLPLLRLSYGDDGGELGRAGPGLAALAALVVAAALGVAWAARPPTIHLAAGTHDGPLVLDRAQTLVGEPGAVVRGGIVIRADDVTVRNVAVVGGATGIEIRDSERVVLDRVRVAGTTLDGISARRSSVEIRDCRVEMPARAGTQAIDISFAAHLAPSLVEGCEIVGASEGIVTHLATATIRGNRVLGTGMRGIAVTEMSMGSVERNVVEDAAGVGIFCGDYSHCAIGENSVSGTRADGSGSRSRAGFGVVVHFHAVAALRANQLDRGAAAFLGGELEHE